MDSDVPSLSKTAFQVAPLLVLLKIPPEAGRDKDDPPDYRGRLRYRRSSPPNDDGPICRHFRFFRRSGVNWRLASDYSCDVEGQLEKR